MSKGYKRVKKIITDGTQHRKGGRQIKASLENFAGNFQKQKTLATIYNDSCDSTRIFANAECSNQKKLLQVVLQIEIPDKPIGNTEGGCPRLSVAFR